MLFLMVTQEGKFQSIAGKEGRELLESILVTHLAILLISYEFHGHLLEILETYYENGPQIEKDDLKTYLFPFP